MGRDVEMSGTGDAKRAGSVVTSPLAETASRISALDSYRSFRVGIPGTEEWIRTDRLADAEVVSAWYERLLGQIADRRAAAAALARSVASAVVLPWAFPVFAEFRLPLASLEETAVHRHPQGWIDGVAFESERVAVLPGDPAAGLPGVEIVTNREALFDVLAQKLVAAEPLFAAVRSLCRIGWPALWGELADQIGSGALWLARLAKRDRWRAWRDAETVLDRLSALQARAKVRPRPFPVAWSGGEELFAVRGTCCLNYRTFVESEPDVKRFCSTCPLRSDEWRAPILRAYLEGK